MKRLFIAAVVVSAAACAPRVPAVRLERSQSSIRQADALGAGQLPNASVFLARAKEEQEVARKLSNAHDPRAETVMACAEADADLALALTREAAARGDQKRATEQVAALRGGNEVKTQPEELKPWPGGEQ
ncbi:MAG: hypothetical protein IPJ65_00880 [Archangiaceae bacterium]|nr:hypothetical protein [Archangiaceae bacterium]